MSSGLGISISSSTWNNGAILLGGPALWRKFYAGPEVPFGAKLAVSSSWTKSIAKSLSKCYSHLKEDWIALPLQNPYLGPCQAAFSSSFSRTATNSLTSVSWLSCKVVLMKPINIRLLVTVTVLSRTMSCFWSSLTSHVVILWTPLSPQYWVSIYGWEGRRNLEAQHAFTICTTPCIGSKPCLNVKVVELELIWLQRDATYMGACVIAKQPLSW